MESDKEVATLWETMAAKEQQQVFVRGPRV